MGTFHGWPQVSYELMLVIISAMLSASFLMYYYQSTKLLAIKADDAAQKMALVASGAVPYVELPSPIPGGNVKIGTCEEVVLKTGIDIGRMAFAIYQIGKGIYEYVKLKRSLAALKEIGEEASKVDDVVRHLDDAEKNLDEVGNTLEEGANQVKDPDLKKDFTDTKKIADELKTEVQNLKKKAEEFRDTYQKALSELEENGKISDETLEELKKKYEKYKEALDKFKKDDKFSELYDRMETLANRLEDISKSAKGEAVSDVAVNLMDRIKTGRDFNIFKQKNGRSFQTLAARELGISKPSKIEIDYDSIKFDIDDKGKIVMNYNVKVDGEVKPVTVSGGEVKINGKYEISFGTGDNEKIVFTRKMLSGALDSVLKSSNDFTKNADNLLDISRKLRSYSKRGNTITQTLELLEDIKKGRLLEKGILTKKAIGRIIIGGYLAFRKGIGPGIGMVLDYIRSKDRKYTNIGSLVKDEKDALKFKILLDNVLYGPHFVTPIFPDTVLFHRYGDIHIKCYARAAELKDTIDTIRSELYSEISRGGKCVECVGIFKDIEDKDFISPELKADFYPFYLAEVSNFLSDGVITPEEAEKLEKILESEEIPESSKFYRLYKELNDKIERVIECIDELKGSGNSTVINDIEIVNYAFVYTRTNSGCYISVIPKNLDGFVPVMYLTKSDCSVFDQWSGFHEGVNSRIFNNMWACSAALVQNNIVYTTWDIANQIYSSVASLIVGGTSPNTSIPRRYRVAICYEGKDVSECRVVEFSKPVELKFEQGTKIVVEDHGDKVVIRGNFRYW